MNFKNNIDYLSQYYNFVDLLKEKHLLTNAISTQIKADLRNLSFKDLDFLDLISVDEQDEHDSNQSTQLSPEDFTSKNFIRNSQFAQWRYGNTVQYQGSSPIYFADHWFGRRGRFANNLIASKVSLLENDSPAMQLLRVEGDKDINEIGIAQLINPTEVVNLAGKTVLFTAKVRCGEGYSARANQITMTIFCSNNSNTVRLNPFTLGKDSQVISTINVNLNQNWLKSIIYGQIPHATEQVMVTFRTGEMSSEPATLEDYFEIMDVELKVH